MPTAHAVPAKGSVRETNLRDGCDETANEINGHCNHYCISTSLRGDPDKADSAAELPTRVLSNSGYLCKRRNRWHCSSWQSQIARLAVRPWISRPAIKKEPIEPKSGQLFNLSMTTSTPLCGPRFAWGCCISSFSSLPHFLLREPNTRCNKIRRFQQKADITARSWGCRREPTGTLSVYSTSKQFGPTFTVATQPMHFFRAHPKSFDSRQGICCEAPKHDADHGKTNECRSSRGVTLEVPSQPAIATDPCEGSFYDPSFW